MEPRRRLAALSFDGDGLVAAVAQQHDTGEVLMLAWMNREAVERDPRHRPRLLLVALAPGAVAQGRELGPCAAPRRAARRLRRRRGAAAGRSDRRRLPHRAAELLLPRRARRRARHHRRADRLITVSDRRSSSPAPRRAPIGHRFCPRIPDCRPRPRHCAGRPRRHRSASPRRRSSTRPRRAGRGCSKASSWLGCVGSSCLRCA